MTPRTRHNIKNALYLTLFLAAVIGYSMWFGSLAAKAAGSDAETPYTVGLHGIQLPAGDAFPAHGHVNLRMTDGSTAGIHFDPNNGHPGGQWIGKSYIPWEAFGFKSTDVCLEWAQLSHYNQHWGEGGQAPVGKACKPKPAPDPTPTPDPEPTPTVTPDPDPEPAATPEPTPEPEPSVTPEPTPACGPIGSCGTVPEKAEDALEPTPEPTFAASSTGPIYATDDTPTDSTPVLAETGADPSIPLMIAAALGLVGAGVAIVRKRWKA